MYKNGKIQRKDIKKKAFDDIKIIVEHITLLAYPDLNNNFDIHTEDRNLQLRSFIRQEAYQSRFTVEKLPYTRINLR